MSSQTLEIDSIRFRVTHEGSKDDPLIILCHALMANSHMWDSTAPALHKAGFSTVRYDHIGHGETEAPSPERVGTFHFDDFVRHIHDIVEKVTPGRPPFGIIGCSMGGVLAIRYAMMYPGTLSKVISCDAPGMTSLELSKPKWRARIAQFEAEGVSNLAKATVERWFPDPCPPEAKAKALDQTRSCSLAGYKTCAEAIMNYDYTDELKNIHQESIMILLGKNDEAIGPPEILIDVAQRIRGSKYVAMENVGHLPPMHDPEAFEKIAIEFLKAPSGMMKNNL